MNAWLTQRADRLYWCCTRRPADIGPVDGTDIETASPRSRDAIGWPAVCDVTVRLLAPAIHKRAVPLEQNRIAMAFLSYDHPEESCRDFVREIGAPMRRQLMAALKNHNPH